jgi:hypothetical protein
LSLDIQLQLGTVTDSVTVTGEPPQLAPRRPPDGDARTSMSTTCPPAGGILPAHCLAAGVTKTSRYWGGFRLCAFGNINSISINGGRSGENDTLIDGVTSVRGARARVSRLR